MKPIKYCPDCKKDLPANSFTRDSRQRDGLSFYCRECRLTRGRVSRYRRKGKPRMRVRPRDLVIPPGCKWCPECAEVKPYAQFPRNRSMRDGYMTYCKPCHNRMGRESKERNGGARNYHLRRRYGITAEHFDRMLAEQNGMCAICREAPAEHVDHDHATGRVRGLLCFNCNGALEWGSPRQQGRSRRGKFRDRTDLMLQAVAYLRGGDWQSAHELPGVTVCFALVNEDPDLAPPADAA